ncbi:acyl carrier protein [Streptomyces sp. NBC_01408]|uniref:acyl carrier protein n=1 Tax=Streptomyces sp. NBC_01408 TaxID=2903855 RepID=UPI002251EF73|nr:acyl carrier protein [Streptomyces sp. NBC_01408]MCX4692906.1 acyl carrier protein [Streptomyces sp. NBC_01408]
MTGSADQLESKGEVQALADWLAVESAALLGTAPERIDRTAQFGEYGLDSIAGLTLAAAIEDHLGIEVDPTVIWDHPSIDELAAFLTKGRAATS